MTRTGPAGTAADTAAVTLLRPGVSTDVDTTRSPLPLDRRRLGAATETVTVLFAYLVWAWWAAGRDAGRDPGTLTWALPLTVPAVFATRPWRHLPPGVLAVVASLPLSAVVVCLFTPYQWAQAPVVAGWVWAGMLFVVAAAFTRTPARRVAVAVAVMFAGFDEFARGFLAWWGGQHADQPMFGTFSWYNPFGAYLIVPAVVGFTVLLIGHGRIRGVGGLVAAFTTAGTVFSTSRGSMGFLGLGFLAVAATALVRAPRRWRVVATGVGWAAATAGLMVVLTGPAVFPHPGSPLAAVLHRAAQPTGSLVGNSGYRLDYMLAGVREFLARPVLGAGFGSFAPLSPGYLPLGKTVLSPYVHNGVLQAFAEGGLVHGVPVLAAVVAVAVAAVGRIRRPPQGAPPWVTVGAGIGVVMLIGHGLVDFDWAYPGVLGMAAVTAGLLVGCPTSPRPVAGRSRARRMVGWGSVGLLVAVGGVATAAVVHVDRVNAVLQAASTAHGRRSGIRAAATLVAAESPLFPDPRIAERIVGLAVPPAPGLPGVLPRPVVWAALHTARRVTAVDPQAQMVRAEVLYAYQNRSAGLAAARPIAVRWRWRRPSLVEPYAAMLYAAGHRRTADRLLLSTIARLTAARFSGQPFDFHATLALLRVLAAYHPTGSEVFRCAAGQYATAYDHLPGTSHLVGIRPPRHPSPPGTVCPAGRTVQ